MSSAFSKGAAFAALAFTALGAHAAGGQIDSFSASATRVTEGDTVDFSVGYSVFASGFSDGGSDLNEPAPQEGNQVWLLNWYNRQTETVREVTLEAGGNSFTDFPSVPANSGHAGGWNFSIVFPTAGRYDIDVNASWRVEVQTESGSESASRDCYTFYNGNFDELSCSSWSYSYPQISDTSSVGGSMGSLPLSIEVLAAVPEPGTLALCLGGLLTLGAVRRARQVAG
jgi:hypothetical protein